MKSTTDFSLEKYYAIDAARLYSHGRHALVAGLKLLNIKEGNKVALPEFICHDLLSSLLSVGASVVYYSIDKDLNPNFSNSNFDDVKAIVMVNYFGFAQDISLFKDIANKSGATLIEDNAHGFLSRDSCNKLLGTRCDIGILSLRKTYHFPDGAALLINTPRHNSELPVFLECANLPLSRGYKIKAVLGHIQKKTGIRLRSYSESLTRFVRKLRTGHKLPISSSESESELPGDPQINCESLRMLKLIDPESEVKRRRSLYIDFHKFLSSFDIKPVYSDLPSGIAPFGYPFRANQMEADKVIKFAHKKGYSCAPWPDLPIALESSIASYHKNIWWVNFLC